MQNKELILPFTIVGISVSTCNREGKASIDLGVLWEKFYLNNIRSKIPNKLSENIYCVYTNYAFNYQGEYTAIIGYKVPDDEQISTELTTCRIEEGKYIKYTTEGQISDLISTWEKIWADSSLNRKYSTDFEVYDERTKNLDHAQIEIYIGIK